MNTQDTRREDVYIKVRNSTIKKTEVLEEARVMIDRDEDGHIVGVEVIDALETRINGFPAITNLPVDTTNTDAL